MTETRAGAPPPKGGYSKKTVLTETGKIDVRLPRDRAVRAPKGRVRLQP